MTKCGNLINDLHVDLKLQGTPLKLGRVINRQQVMFYIIKDYKIFSYYMPNFILNV